MSVHSGGILLFRYVDDQLQVMLVHPGGPFWTKKDEGAWSIPKGIFKETEGALEAAKREFKEETGFEIDGEFVELGEIKQPSGKIVHAWALEKELEVNNIQSNTFSLEWPKNSGNVKEYPEIDRAQWFDIDEAKKKILKGQVEFIDRLTERLGYVPPNVSIKSSSGSKQGFLF
jgi:predicted NUDIX family NTP pyrophosphohydrolase